MGRKSLVKFGIGTLVVLLLVLIGFFIYQSITTFAAINPGTAPAGFVQPIGINTSGNTTTYPYFANITDEFFTNGNVVFIYANYSCAPPDDCTLLNVTANFSAIGVNASLVNATRRTPCASTHCIYSMNATVNFANISGGVSQFATANITINATNATFTDKLENFAIALLVNMSVMPGCPPQANQIPPAIPLLNGTLVNIANCVTNCAGDDRAEWNGSHYVICGPNFGGSSTNFTQTAYNGNMSNVSLVIDIPNKAKIEFHQGINMSDQYKMQAIMQFAMKNLMSGGRIGVNETEWDGSAGKPNLNLTATLTIYNISKLGIDPPHMPTLSRRSTYGNESVPFAPCPTNICSGVTYQIGTVSNFSFIVSSFSEYEVSRGLAVELNSPTNYSYITNSSFVSGSVVFRNINFTFTPRWNATTSPRIATLYGNFTGSWAANVTNATFNETGVPLVNNTINFINRTVGADGAYLWNIVINDTNNVTDTNTLNWTVIVDTIKPEIRNLSIILPFNAGDSWNTSVNNNTYIKGTSAIFKINVSDKYVNTTNVSLRKNLGAESGFPSTAMNCYGRDGDIWICNVTLDLTGYADGTQIQYYYEASDNATNLGINGSSTSYWLATLDNTPPKYANNATNVTSVGKYDGVLIYANWTDGYNVDWAILETNESGTALNKSVAAYKSPFDINQSAGQTWSNFTWSNSSVPTGATVSWRIFANDTAGNWNVTTVYTFSIESAPPQYSNVGTNDTDNVIARDHAINLSTKWTDGTALSYAVLETNESGTVLNKTAIYNASLSGTSAWSNFTWSNTSGQTIVSGAVIQWRVFANDSSDNWNVTTAQTFSIDSTPPQWSGNTTNTTAGLNYVAGRSYQFNITVTDNTAIDKVVLEFIGRVTNNYTATQDGSTYYQSITDLPANTTGFPNGFLYQWFINDTSRNDNSTGYINYTVNKAPSNVTLRLNGTSADSTYEKGQLINQSALSNVTGLTVSLINDFSGVNVTFGVGTTHINGTNSTATMATGTYWVSANTSANENYTASTTVTLKVTLQDTTVPTVLIYDYVNETVAKQGASLTFNINITDNDLNRPFTNPYNATVTITTTNAGNITNDSASWLNGSVSVPAGLSDGLNRVNITVSDQSGNTGFNQSYFVKIDNTNPVLNNTVPVNYTYIKGISTNVFGLDVTDTNLNATNVTIYFNKPGQSGFSNKNITTCYNKTATNDFFTCNITWSQMTLTTYSDGSSVTYYYEATDNATNFNKNGTSSSYHTVFIDATAPQYVNNATNVTSVGKYDGVLIYTNWTDGYTLDWAVLETNESGTALNKTTYSSPFNINQTAGQTWSNFTWSNSSLSLGVTVKWRIFANDTANNWNVTANGTFTIENNWPQVVAQTTNTTNNTVIAKGTQINISANWTDDNILSRWWVWLNESNTTGANRTFTSFTATTRANSTYNIDTSSFPVNSSGIVFLARFYANDTSGNENMTGVWQWQIDGTKPVPIAFSTNTTNASTIAKGTQINISANWTDDIGLSRWWVWLNESNTTGANRTWTTFAATNNSNSTFNIDTSGFNTSIVFEARFFANDTSGNENTTTPVNSPTWQWTIDGTVPSISNVTTSPASPQVYLPGRSYIFNVSMNDAIGVSKVLFEWNRTTNFTDSSTPAVVNNAGMNYSVTITDLAVSSANYTYKWFANDTSNNWGVSAQFTYNVTLNTTNPITFYLNGTENANLSVRYPAQVNATALPVIGSAGTLNIYRNGSSVTSENNTNVRLGNVTYTYLANITGNANYTSNTTAEFYVFVTKGITTISLALNGTGGNVSYDYPQTINATGWNTSAMIDSQFNVSLYRNDTAVSSTITGAPIYQYILLPNATYNYTLDFNGSTNYTDTSAFYFAYMNKGPTNMTLLLGATGSETSANATMVLGTNLNITATINTTYSVTLMINTTLGDGWINQSTSGTRIENTTSTSGFSVANNYIINASFPGDQNFTATSRVFYLNITGDSIGPTVFIYDDASNRYRFNNDTAMKVGKTFKLNISIADSGIGMTSGEYCNVTIGGLSAVNGTYSGSSSSGWCNITVSVPSGLSDGLNRMNITTADTNDNVGFNDTYYILVDSTPPVFSSMSANGTYNRSTGGFTWINGTISDNLQMGTGNVTINGTQFNTTTSGVAHYFNGTNNTVFGFRNNTSLSDGYVAVQINYTDNATNIGNVTVYFYVDNTGPTSISANTTGTLPRNSTQEIKVTVIDNLMTNASITLFYYRYGYDTAWQTTTMTGTIGANTAYNTTIDTNLVGVASVAYYVAGTDNATNIMSSTNGSATSPLGNFTVGTAGSISGSIYLTNSSVTPNSSVVVGIAGKTATTNTTGGYLITDITPAAYTLTISGVGYWTNSTSVTISAAATTTVNMQVTGAENFNVTIPGTATSSSTVNGFLDFGWHTFWLRTGVFSGSTANYTVPDLFKTIGTSGSYNYSSVWLYNSTTGGWASFIPGTSGNTLTNVTSGSELYYVHANTTDRVEIEARYR